MRFSACGSSGAAGSWKIARCRIRCTRCGGRVAQSRPVGVICRFLWLDLKRVLREVKPDLIHAGPVPNVAFLAALSGFRPLVSMSWGSDLLRDIDQDANQRRAARYALNHSDVLVGDCLAVQRKAVQIGFSCRTGGAVPLGRRFGAVFPRRSTWNCASDWGGRMPLFVCRCVRGSRFTAWM